MEPSNPHSLRQELSAFADGELPAAPAARLQQHLATDPAAAAELQRIQQLSTSARRAITQSTPPPSTDLLSRLHAMTPIEPQAQPRPLRSPSWIGFGIALAATVLLAVGVGIGRWSTRLEGSHTNPADVIPASVIADAEKTHGYCSRLALGLHTAGYPADVAGLADAVEKDLHSDHPYPDFTSIGFAYRGAGPCGKPLDGTAHLLYRSLRPGSVSAISVFVQPWHNQYPLLTDRLYTVSIAQSPFPMLAWRTDHVVYFLLADNDGTERAAVAVIRKAATSSN